MRVTSENTIGPLLQPPLKTAADNIARPLFVAYMGEMLKHTGVVKVFSNGSDSGVGFGFLAGEAIAESMAREENPLYRNWLAHFEAQNAKKTG